jgi:hypothetical protein
LIIKEKTGIFKMLISKCPKCTKKVYKNMGANKADNSIVARRVAINFALLENDVLPGSSKLIRPTLRASRPCPH